ncbi:MAG: hypothetical protein WC565_10540 [Parcubacteria group bacterium]|jgi:hypothetical protein
MESKEAKLNKIANAPTEQPKATDASVFTSVAFVFTGEADRNIKTNWPGELPRAGELVQLRGRDTIWKVHSLQWIFDIDPSAGKFQRAAFITLEKLT